MQLPVPLMQPSVLKLKLLLVKSVFHKLQQGLMIV